MRTMLLILLLCSSAQAGILEIRITGLDLQYDGTSIYDAGEHNTVTVGNPAQADTLTSMAYYLNGNLVGVQSTDVYADVYLGDVLNIPKTGGVVSSFGNEDWFGVHLLNRNSIPGWGLAFQSDYCQLLYTGSQFGIALSGFATDQSLPFGLENEQYDLYQPISIVLFSESFSGLTTEGGFITAFNSVGSGSVSEFTPEPSSIVLGATGIICLAAIGLRRRNH